MDYSRDASELQTPDASKALAQSNTSNIKYQFRQHLRSMGHKVIAEGNLFYS